MTKTVEWDAKPCSKKTQLHYGSFLTIVTGCISIHIMLDVKVIGQRSLVTRYGHWRIH